MKKEHRLEITLCGRVVADFTDERDMMETAAARITEWDAMAKRHAEQSVQLALAIGAVLLAVKGKVPHGTFLLWVSQNCGHISERTARKYMLLAATAARRQELEESAGGASTDEERKELAIATTDAERHYERSLSQLYLDWGIVRRPEGWGGRRNEKAAENGHAVGRPSKGSPTVEEELDAAANYEPAMWASAEGAIRTVAELDARKQLFSRLEDGHLAIASRLLGDLARKAGEALEARLARRDAGLRGEEMETGEAANVLERGV